MTHNIDAETVTQYATWNPAEQVRATYRAAHKAAPTIERKPIKNQPPPPRPELVDDDQLQLNSAAGLIACEAMPKSYHWIPATLTACVRCGREADDIINELNQLEISA